MAKSAKKSKNTWQVTELKPTDVFLSDPKNTDIVIAVMGPTGAGKSTFINTLFGEAVAEVGHDLQSQTAQVQHYILNPKSEHRTIIVDTPGFDDTIEEDREILRRIAVWLARSYDAGMNLAGVIYLHEITQTRMLGTARKNLDMFNKLCGVNKSDNIVLASTKWIDVKQEIGNRREEQLKKEHWKEMMNHGAKAVRFDGTQKSAQDIIKLLFQQEAVDPAEIQRELVDIDKFLAETAAGRTLRYTLDQLLEEQKKLATQLHQEDGGQDLKQQIHENEEKIRSTLRQIGSLSISFSQRLKRWFRLRCAKQKIFTNNFALPAAPKGLLSATVMAKTKYIPQNTWQKTEVKSSILHEPMDTDIVIPIVGMTGAGKSTARAF
ncbi:hypothetical protein D9615_003467 [Tricholomella constricta]|uniref:G domain-containing protein n=1 Tax=Tricholomella constricta TaxID=117010 RepID=A0A8H5HJU5_9AGAR|nr:hypothetical protein D9615_003467 [Tricholomella constricta]